MFAAAEPQAADRQSHRQPQTLKILRKQTTKKTENNEITRSEDYG